MYRRYLKPCTHRFYDELNSQVIFASCQSMLRGFSPTFWRRAQVERRRVSTNFPYSWLSCQGFDCIPSIPTAVLFLKQQNLLVGHALRGYLTTSAGVSNPSRQSLFPQRERLLRISSSFTRSCSDDRGTDGKSQASVSTSLGSGGDNDKGAEYGRACSSGSEDESDEGQNRRYSTTTVGNQDEISKESCHHVNKDSLYLAQKTRFRKAFEKRLQRWEDAKVTLEEFPHYLSGTTRDLLVDCAAAHLRHPRYAEFGSGLSHSNRRICLRGPTGTLLHQERLVEALAHHLQAPLLVLDSTSLAPHDFGAHELLSASSSDESDSENESTSALSDGEKEEGFGGRMSGVRDVEVDVLLELAAGSVQVESQHVCKKETIMDGSGEKQGRGKSTGSDENRASALSSCNVSAADPYEEWVASIDALCEMSSPSKPMVVYFPDPRQWFERAVPLDRRQEFLERVEAKLDQVEGPIVMIASSLSDEETEADDRARLRAYLENIRSRLNQRTSTRWVFRELLGSEDVYELFPNHIKIYPPKEDGILREWKKQLLKDKEISLGKHNIGQLREVLETNYMDCESLSALNLLGLNLSKTKAEKIVGWARNHLLGMSLFDPPTSNGKLMIPRDSMERALTRLRVQENKKPTSIIKDFKTVAEDEYEKALISAVIPPNEVGVKFDHIGALEDVKSALKELVMLPLQRPELFCKGNLTRPCKGVLLFGPPGTGKTLLAKAVATEAGANFINITGSTITSKWFGDAEKLTKSLFSLAKKLAPAVIFVDEVDSLLGARGGSSEHEATRKTRNEFMAAWDGLRSKDNERVLVLAATNRPFDLDDAVIRRLPRRILVDLPNTENRVKILRVILADEELEEGFDYAELSRITDGYSGSDLKNLSIAAAYRPIRELLLYEEQEGKLNGTAATNRARSSTVIRPLRFDDFKQAMTQVGASVAFDASSMNELRRWNEQYGEGGNRKKSTFGFIV